MALAKFKAMEHATDIEGGGEDAGDGGGEAGGRDVFRQEDKDRTVAAIVAAMYSLFLCKVKRHLNIAAHIYKITENHHRRGT